MDGWMDRVTSKHEHRYLDPGPARRPARPLLVPVLVLLLAWL